MTGLQIRRMRREDLKRVAELSDQLGYLVSPEALERRFQQLSDRSDQAVFVAEIEHRVIGWTHVHPQVLLESEPYAEIGGLVVDRDARRLGVGAALVEEAQRWASGLGFDELRVRSNAARSEAHQFYPAIGFKWIKTQHNYVLKLSAGNS